MTPNLDELVELATKPFEQPEQPLAGEGLAQAATIDVDRIMLSEEFDDEGHAQCMLALYPDSFLHVDGKMGWLHYNGTHWTTEGADPAVERAITEMLKYRASVALKAPDPRRYEKLIRSCVRDHGNITGIKAQFRSLVDSSMESFDENPDLLNCKNGVVNLKTGELTPHSAKLRFLSCSKVPYKPDADYSEWVKWLSDVAPDQAEYLQKATGYSLTGHTSEEVLFYVYGPPRSGKGTFVEAIAGVLGSDLSKQVPFSVFTQKNDADSQNFALAPLKTARFISASENNKSERFNEAKMKSLTGGDRVACCFKGKDMFNYKPQYKIWLSSNNPVRADADDDAVWGRIRLIRFPHSHLGKEDKGLKQKLLSQRNLESVLAWAVEGAKAWYTLGSAGLPELERLAGEKQQQRDGNDIIAMWFEENYEIPEQTGIDDQYLTVSEVYTNFANWCRANGKIPEASNKFSERLTKRYTSITAAKKYMKIDGQNKQVRVFTNIANLY